jgi:hypothetical protein
MAPDTLEALGEATDDVEYQRTVADQFSKVSEGVGHVLEVAAVLRDGQVPLTEVAELGVEMEGASLLIPEELILEGKPNGASRGIPREHRLRQVVGDGAGDPGLDDAVHAAPIRKIGRRGVLEDVIIRGVLADDEELTAPTLVVVIGEVEDDVDEVVNVLDAGCVVVQIGGGGLVQEHGVAPSLTLENRSTTVRSYSTSSVASPSASRVSGAISVSRGTSPY